MRKKLQSICTIYSRPFHFTLIELLIVVAIIAILAGMLLPALNMARSKAKASNCLGNAKQLGSALQMYLADNKEYLPMENFYGHSFPSFKSAKQSALFVLFPYTGNAKRMEDDMQCNKTTPLVLKTPLPKTFLCPATNYNICTWWKSHSGHMGYSVSKFIVGNKLTLFKQPSRTLYLTDNRAGYPGESSEGATDTMHIAVNGGSSQNALSHVLANSYYSSLFALKHQKKANTAFIDGSVRPLGLLQLHCNSQAYPWGIKKIDGEWKLNPDPLPNPYL